MRWGMGHKVGAYKRGGGRSCKRAGAYKRGPPSLVGGGPLLRGGGGSTTGASGSPRSF